MFPRSVYWSKKVCDMMKTAMIFFNVCVGFFNKKNLLSLINYDLFLLSPPRWSTATDQVEWLDGPMFLHKSVEQLIQYWSFQEFSMCLRDLGRLYLKTDHAYGFDLCSCLKTHTKCFQVINVSFWLGNWTLKSFFLYFWLFHFLPFFFWIWFNTACFYCNIFLYFYRNIMCRNVSCK